MNAIEIKKNKQGFRVALCENSVWIEKQNYNRGKIIKQWAYIVKDVPQAEAEKIFSRRIK